MTTLSIEDLKAWLALLPKVTPGPYTYGSKYLCRHRKGMYYERIAQALENEEDSPRWNTDAAHLAKCDPATIAALIEGYIAMAEAKSKVSVKPLEWCQSEDGTEWYSTDDPSNNGRGTYWIHPSKLNDGEFELRIVEQRDGSYLDTEAAKAAAQADYEARILSALNIGGTND